MPLATIKLLRKLFTSEIDMIPNVGAKRKKNLLLYFKSIEEIKMLLKTLQGSRYKQVNCYGYL